MHINKARQALYNKAQDKLHTFKCAISYFLTQSQLKKPNHLGEILCWYACGFLGGFKTPKDLTIV